MMNGNVGAGLGAGLLSQIMGKSGIDLKGLNPKFEGNSLVLDMGEAELREALLKGNPSMASCTTLTIENNRVKVTFKLM